MKLSEPERQGLELAVSEASLAFESGNYPVGAALLISERLVASAGNRIFEKKSFTNHAELSLIISHGTELFEAYEQGKDIILISTLEPCVQCLGASVTNHVSKIIYIVGDPNGGACALRHDNIGLHYKDNWPEIQKVNYSDEPLKLMKEYFRQQVSKGNKDWPAKMLRLYGED